ncbi:YbdK family carboxylate-amine ligase [Miniimonas arenae]|uniref:Putative glutamate--cysteine ligase 2 n=1 Tax=Miniimonas arenae TaxID=676201 RepID=A0A5C5B9A1_9MICO|nr:glutamate--cysteine ligase [Miniimonas arenae]TNU73281.1 YbdK family carboxylate-amine ligase [Miniimonas arenae]
MRTVGVEEEYLLVGEHGEAVARSRAVLATPAASAVTADAAEANTQSDAESGADPNPTTTLESELQEQQVEISTPPATDLAAVADALRLARRRAQDAAAQANARIVAIGTSPLPATTVGSAGERYERIRDLLALTAREQLTSGAHVHVGISDEDEGVRILDRIRPWLSVLVALGSNSPFWQGEDTGYSSYRSLVFRRWPTAGPTDAFGSPETYHRTVEQLLATGAILDEGMVYFDARLSARYPTVEVRVSDVTLAVEHAVTLAALVRALADTAAQPDAPAPDVRIEVLRLMGWRAARSGLSGELVSPVSFTPLPAEEVVGQLLEHVDAALTASGDRTLVHDGVAHLLRDGDGATRQRAWFAETGSLAEVVGRAHEVTMA